MNLNQTILDNIKAEAKAHLKYGKALPKRDPRWDKEVAQALIAVREQLEVDFEVVYRSFHKSSKSNMPYDQWITIAKSLYTITGTTVTSIAKGLDNGKTWQCKSFGEAQDKVKKLLAYKFQDHFNRGADFMFVPSMFRAVG